MRDISEIIVHCTATRPDFMPGATTWARRQEIRRWHLDRGWSDIGYHYLIDRDGTAVNGRPVERVGAHVQGHNTGTIGVSLFGGHGSAETDDFSENFTPEQDRALRALLADLQKRFPGVRKVSGHNEYAAKACPGFSVSAWLRDAPARPDVEPPTTTPQRHPVASGLFAALLAAVLKAFRKGPTQ